MQGEPDINDGSADASTKASTERQLLMVRINHLDGLALTIRNIGIPVFLATFGGCAGLKLGIISAKATFPYDAQFVLPVAAALIFFVMEARVRNKYELCAARWNVLAGRPLQRDAIQASRQYDWLVRERRSLRGSVNRDIVLLYGAMALVTILAWAY